LVRAPASPSSGSSAPTDTPFLSPFSHIILTSLLFQGRLHSHFFCWISTSALTTKLKSAWLALHSHRFLVLWFSQLQGENILKICNLCSCWTGTDFFFFL
jgi:hypothetical protein